MKRLFAALALAAVALGLSAQPSGLLAASSAIATAVTATGTQAAVKGLSAVKTYQVTGATSVGTAPSASDKYQFHCVGTQ